MDVSTRMLWASPWMHRDWHGALRVRFSPVILFAALLPILGLPVEDVSWKHSPSLAQHASQLASGPVLLQDRRLRMSLRGGQISHKTRKLSRAKKRMYWSSMHPKGRNLTSRGENATTTCGSSPEASCPPHCVGNACHVSLTMRKCSPPSSPPPPCSPCAATGCRV